MLAARGLSTIVGDPCADAVLLSLVTLEGHAIGRLVHRGELKTFLQLLFLAVIIIAAHALR